ncbi:MAG: aminotransferase class I/II-fold pyridoxal phosphate-dependent enzyme [Alphaproteobacteria bacterium]
MTARDAFFAPRMSRFKPSPSQIATQRVRELVGQGKDIVKLTAGEPDFPTPLRVKWAVMQAMDRDEANYTPVNGTQPMREAAQLKFKRDNDLDYGLDEICVASGAKQILFNILMASVSAGDEVIIPSPYWASYPDMVQLAGGTPVFVDCPQNRGFRMSAEDFEAAITPETKWLMLCQPSNPAGVVYSKDELQAIADVALKYPHVHIITDDVYEHLIFDGRAFHTIAAVEPRLKDRTVTVNSVSKAFSMTGWRVGYAGGPKDIIANAAKMQSQSSAGSSAIGQAAAIEALTGPQDLILERTADLQRRRDILYAALNKADGLHCDLPEGAMYCYCSCAGAIGKTTPNGKVIQNDTDFTMYLLDHAGVAVVQGAAYGLSPYFRASFVAPTEDLIRGGGRIQKACAELID